MPGQPTKRTERKVLLAATSLIGIAAALGFLLLGDTDRRSRPPDDHAAAEALSEEYAQILQRQYENLAADPPYSTLRGLTCQKDHDDFERQQEFRAQHPPPHEAILHYQQVRVAVSEVAVSGDTGEFVLTESHPSQETQYQRYRIERYRGGWSICGAE